MADIKNVIQQVECARNYHRSIGNNITADIMDDALELLKEYEVIKETISNEIHETAKTFRRTEEQGNRSLIKGRSVKWE